ncbi:hypothetical protein GQ464_000430 [Rhodocaloribacter litoris]|uniref:hypothetical protein n=1 Tax=Rhodocaloribacter litoris TaxID=2558931 RepID=UPI00142338E2|nr:hypothetical protein [Rhodocaloribacter litoris]QXD15454.1 hypothetical protein GQ464_000430 [Rhodocaloribacter litoris]GIV60361.1 MAG: hypothetical protein KatS3mg043_1450 [Rhodothermaceae bacterium]
MTTIELRQHIDALLAALGNDRVLPRYIFILARGYQQLADELMELVHVRNRTQFFKKQQVTQDRFYDVRKQSDTFPPGHVFHEAIQLLELLERVRAAFATEEEQAIREVHALVERFYGAAEQYARSGNDEAFAALLTEASHLYPSLISMRRLLGTLRAVLFDEAEASGAEASLSVHFRHARTYGAVVEKLASLERAYLEICDAAEVSTEAYPLKIAKVETGGVERGGLWVVVRGEAHILDVLGSLIGRFALFLYRRLATGEGQVFISDRVLANQALVNLTDELERIGYRFGSREEARLQKTALLLRRDLVTLLAGEPSVRVNDQLFEVEAGAWPDYISESMQLLPKYNTVVHLSEQAG